MSIRIGASRIGPRVGTVRARRGRSPSLRLAGVLIAATFCCVLSAGARAQTKAEHDSQKAAVKQASGRSDMLVEADEMVYNKDNNTVSAVGHAKVYYQGRVLEADKVTYYRQQKRVLAEGNAKLTDEEGNVFYGTTFELTDDFKNAFMNSLLVVSKETPAAAGNPAYRTRFASPRGERVEGETTTFDNGTYTACEPCKDDPTKPPLWQVRAKRIIDNHVDHKIYYEDAWLEFYGWPVAYTPYFSAPDPSVRRASGFLAPHFFGGTNVGYGVGIPYFWALAPDYDVTITPNFLSQQGVLGELEWRQRLANGTYSITVSGIDQADPKTFSPAPYEAGNKKFRGSVESKGKFYINENWKYGWDVAGATDKWFFHDYKIRASNISWYDFNTVREAISTAYLTGKAGRSWFDLRGFYFESLNALDYQKQIPVAAPVLDYDRRFNGPSFLGGEFTLNANMANVNRQAAQFVNTNPFFWNPLNPNNPNTFLFHSGDGTGFGNLYTACAVYSKADCLVRGVPGDYARASVDLTWRRRIIDDLGEVWTPFAYVKGQTSYTNIDTTGFNNFEIGNFLSPSQDIGARAMPAIGLEYRFPLVAAGQWGTAVVEPIAQVIARPNESRIGHLPNEDAQSLVFDDSNLFQWDKFSGYDRMEGGTRANYGIQGTFTAPGGAYVNALFGESYQIAGVNSFARPDLANTGLDSGLDTKRSDFVGRVQFQPFGWFSTTLRGRFDEKDLAANRLEVTSSFVPFQALNWFPDNKQLRSVTFSGSYAHIEAQPDLGLFYRRDALNLSGSWNFWNDWTASGGITFDLSNHLVPVAVSLNPAIPLHYSHGLFEPSSTSMLLQYKNDCCTFKGQFVTGYSTSSYGYRVHDEAVMFTLELRTLGAVSYSSDVSSLYNSVDGLNSNGRSP